jgi:hypothetical protein
LGVLGGLSYDVGRPKDHAEPSLGLQPWTEVFRAFRVLYWRLRRSLSALE